MNDLYGLMGAIACVDLTTGAIDTIETQPMAESFIGGRGFAEKLYRDMVPADAAAFSDENILALMCGPLSGSRAIACARLVVYGKSALLYPDQSAIASLGGPAAHRLKAAGFDGIIVRGRAAQPVCLEIKNRRITLRDASGLWGRDIPDTLSALGKEYGENAAVCCIGPAGERQLRMANLGSSNGSFAGHGFGAVCGWKNIKAFVMDGDMNITVARPERLAEINRQIRSMIKGRILMDPMIEGIELDRRSPCPGCPAGCPRGIYRHTSGIREHRKNCASAYFYSDWDKQHHDGNQSGDSFLATSACDRAGLCTQEISKLLIWLHAAMNQEILGDRAADLPRAPLGSNDFIMQFIDGLIARTGIYDLLAEGTMRAAREFGEQSEALLEGVVEGAGFSADLYNPRYFLTNALFHATDSNPMPQLHEVCYPTFKWVLWYATDGMMSPISTEILRAVARRFWLDERAVDYSSYEGKGAVACRIQNRQYAKETLVACDFFYPIVTAEGTADHVGDPSIESRLLSAVSGMDVDEQEYYRIGERVFNLQRAIFCREGHCGRRDDVLPDFNFAEPLLIDKIYFGIFNPDFMLPGPGGELITRKGAVLDRDGFERMLDEYYRHRGWETATGLQTDAKLRELGLEWLIPDIAKQKTGCTV